MNYRHSFHAGNFADVFKHAVLARMLAYLLKKLSPFRYIDTHAGVGVYDLRGDPACRTGEWELGIKRILDLSFSTGLMAFLEPYLGTVQALNADGQLRYYPGSPDIARQLLRGTDRMLMCELHPDDADHLRWRYAKDDRMKICAMDGWTGLNAFIPPKERRGIVLADPPFEKAGEFDRLHDALAHGARKWATGIFALWYPIKHISDANAFARKLETTGLKNLLRTEIYIREPVTSASLNGCGLMILNPPWLLEEELRAVLPELSTVLAQDKGAGWKVETLDA
jgi:23S rRNA (adenine2030-N6)-methyltransferase